MSRPAPCLHLLAIALLRGDQTEFPSASSIQHRQQELNDCRIQWTYHRSPRSCVVFELVENRRGGGSESRRANTKDDVQRCKVRSSHGQHLEHDRRLESYQQNSRTISSAKDLLLLALASLRCLTIATMIVATVRVVARTPKMMFVVVSVANDMVTALRVGCDCGDGSREQKG